MARTERSGHTTTDHDFIRRWVEERGGWPARVEGTGRGRDPGLIRIDFPGYSGEGSLERIEWDDWFQGFENNQLAFLHRDMDHGGGDLDRFNKLISRTGEDDGEGSEGGGSSARGRGTGGRSASARGGAGRKSEASEGGASSARGGSARKSASGGGGRGGSSATADTGAKSGSRSASGGGTSARKSSSGGGGSSTRKTASASPGGSRGRASATADSGAKSGGRASTGGGASARKSASGQNTGNARSAAAADTGGRTAGGRSASAARGAAADGGAGGELRDLLLHELGDLLSAEKLFLSGTRTLAREAQDPEVRARVEQHVTETEGQIERIKAAFGALGERPKAVTCEAAKGLKEEHDSFKSDEKPSRLLLSAFGLGSGLRVEHYEIAAYRGAIELATALGERQCAQILNESLKEELAMASFLEKNSRAVLKRMAAGGGESAPSAASARSGAGAAKSSTRGSSTARKPTARGGSSRGKSGGGAGARA